MEKEKEIEIWKPIVGYEGLYEVSSLGNVRSIDRFVVNSCGVKIFKKGFMLKPRTSNRGYLRVQLTKDGIHRGHSIHRLVAYAFLDNNNNLPCVNHKDENPLNNRVDNLEWCTYKYNSNYGNARKKLSNSKKKYQNILQLDLEGNIIREYASLTDVLDFGFNRNNVSACCKEKMLSYKGFLWVYKENQNKIPYIVEKQKTTPKALKEAKTVLVYDQKGKLIQKFKSAKEASVFYKTCVTTISNYCTIRPVNKFNLLFKYAE